LQKLTPANQEVDVRTSTAQESPQREATRKTLIQNDISMMLCIKTAQFSLSILLVALTAMQSTGQQANRSPLGDAATKKDTLKNHGDPLFQPDPLRISNYIRRIFQDKKGHLWFGTNGDGVCRYDGDALKYFSVDEGFAGVAVRGIVEDRIGNVWFGTEQGLTKFDGTSFTNFKEKDGLIGSDVWSIMIDSKGMIWVGTLNGVCRFNGKEFAPFVLPAAKPDYSRGVTSANIVHCIMEDRKGRMWFASNDGAYFLDGETLTNISEKDGLCHNSVNDILEDRDGNIWFATHHNGVCRWDGKSFTHISAKDGVIGTEAWKLYKDNSGNIWFPIEHSGLYRYDGKGFTNFHREQGLHSEAIQCFLEDREGRIWAGGVFGLFRLDHNSFSPVTKEGPWK
jgi:ligand-binding sensor domain-containing protein